jgi:hypothetical protein
MAGQGNSNRRPLNKQNNDIGDFFTRLMNSSKTGVGTPQARNIGSPAYYGPGGNRDGSGQDQAQQSPGVGPFQGHGTVDVPRPSQPTGDPAMGGDRTTTNANGVQQTMRAMSSTSAPIDMQRSFNNLLTNSDLNETRKDTGFMSEQLPTTAGSPDQNIGPVANGQEYANNLGRQGTQGIGPVVDGQVYGNLLENAPNAGTKGIGPLADGAAYAQSLGKGNGSTSRLDAALNDKEGINSYMSKFSSGDRERAANRAFLDTKGSMEGLRAKEAVNGVVYAGQNHYIAGADADGPAQKITRDEARNISSGEASAQALLKSYTQGITESGAATPAERQDPAMSAQDAVKSGFAAGAKTDFELNNNQGAPQTGVGPTVPLNEIPKDLSGAAGKEYLRKLDSGALFN